METLFSGGFSGRGGDEDGVAGGGSVAFVDETYNLKGINLVAPDQIMPAGQSPYTINSRSYATDDGQSRVASRTRKGSSRISTAIGETLNVQNVTAGTLDYAFGDLADTTRRLLAQPFTLNATGNLTRLDIDVRKDAGSTGHILIRIYTDASGFPGSLIAASSILAINLTTSMQLLTAYFMDAPTLASGTKYWIVVLMQDNGKGTYYWKQQPATGGLSTVDGGSTWSLAGGSFRFKSYLSTSQPVKGWARRYPSTGASATLAAAAGSIYSITDLGVTTVLDATLDASAVKVRFLQESFNDYTIWVNGINNARYTSDGVAAQDLTGPQAGATHLLAFNNRLFLFYANTNKMIYSDTQNPTSYPSVNFLYFPNPKSSDHLAAVCNFQSKIVVFTHKTKYIVSGSDVATFQRNEAVGTKGAVSQEAVAVDRNFIYFMADDGRIYRYNGISDELISDNVQPETQGIFDKSSVRLHLYNNQLRVYYHKSPDTFNNRMLLYDIATKEWFMDTGRAVQGSLTWDQDANQLIEFSSRCTWMFQGEQGYSDLGKAISYKYWTNYKTYGYRRRTGQSFGGGSTKKRVKFFRPVVRITNSDYTLSVGKDMDFANTPDMRAYVITGSGAKWGSFIWGNGTKWGSVKLVDKRSGMSGRGHHLQYRFEREGVETPTELYGYIASIKIGKPK